jgi:hypothetical protein
MRVLGVVIAVLVLLGLGIWWWMQPSDFVLVVKVLDNQTAEADPSDVGRFTVQLSKNPWDTIILQLSSSSPDQGLPEVDSLTFTESDWDLPKTVTVLGQDEWIDDDDVIYTIRLFWEDPKKERKEAEAIVSMLGVDDDQMMILIGHSSSEDPNRIDLNVRLATQPIAEVELWVRGGDSSWNYEGRKKGTNNLFKGTSNPRNLHFDEKNWNVPQKLEIRSSSGSLNYSKDDLAYQNYDWVIRDAEVKMQWLKMVVFQPSQRGDYVNMSHSVLINPQRCLRCNLSPDS